MNEAQIEHWNGPDARRWVELQDQYDRQLAPFANALLRSADLRDGEIGRFAEAFFGQVDGAEPIGVDELPARSSAGEVALIDVRRASSSTPATSPERSASRSKNCRIGSASWTQTHRSSRTAAAGPPDWRAAGLARRRTGAHRRLGHCNPRTRNRGGMTR